MTKPQSPEEFFAAQVPRAKCFLCRLTIREEMERAHRNGVPLATLHRWVVAIHPDVRLGQSAISRHFAERHHERTDPQS